MKVPFNKLNKDLTNKIIEEYYVKKDLSFKGLSDYLLERKFIKWQGFMSAYVK